MKSGEVKYIKKTVGELEANSYILYSEESENCILIDPGAEGAALLKLIEEKNLKLIKIILTHGHIDHCGGVNEIISTEKIPVMIHRDDLPVLSSHINMDLGKSLGLTPPLTADEFPVDGDKIEISGLTIEVLHTPGHSPGSICLKCGNILFSGDTLFAGSIGRTDLRGGDYNTIIKSLERLKSLPPDTIVLPGHGDKTNMENELALNPFL